jgi:hypothetical protein
MVCIIASIYTSSRLEADRQIHRRESARRLEWFSLGAMRDHRCHFAARPEGFLLPFPPQHDLRKFRRVSAVRLRQNRQ